MRPERAAACHWPPHCSILCRNKRVPSQEAGNISEGEYHGAHLAQAISGRRTRRHRRDAIFIAGRTAGRKLQEIQRPQSLHLHGQVDQLSRARRIVAGARRLSAEQGPAEGRAGRADDAERAAISGGDRRGAARGLCGGQRQSALHAARTRAPAQGFRRRGDYRSGEFRDDGAAGARQDRGEARHHRQHGRPARLQGHDRQFRGAQGEEDGAAVFDSGRGEVQRRHRGRPRHETQQAEARDSTTSPSCNTPAAPPAFPRARRCSIATFSPTCCRTMPGCSRR